MHEVRPTDQRSPEWMGLRQVTQYASVCERTVRSWIHMPVDPLPACLICGKVLISRTELDRWLQRHRIQSSTSIDLDAILRNVVQSRKVS